MARARSAHQRVAGARRHAKLYRVAEDREDAALLKQWQNGPGARPTDEERQRWLKATHDGEFPRRRLAAG
jgi:hypothetical protein